ncbi:MAG: hypothetical protein LBN34_06485 [Clostridiales Family XIII bacterium]|jgi:SNF2 family DNA or RNA helicase|nr:hypothetical protein [Clostridiales Family XIII bacterium]
MNDYAQGMRLIIRDEEWMVRKVETNRLDQKALYCVGITPLVKDHETIFLSDLEEIEQVDPTKIRLVPDESPFFRKSRLYIEGQWRKKIPTDNAIHIGDKAAMDMLNYQLLPAQTALSKLRQRILIADSVGLGKTLEAGILMSELILRGKGKRILVVTVKSMMTQFQKEMWNRFTIPLVRLDSKKIQKVRSQLPSNYNPFFYYDKTIISVDTLKQDVAYRTTEEIRRYAFGILKGISFDDLDDGYDNGKDCQSLTHDDIPEINRYKSQAEEISHIIDEIRNLTQAGIENSNICIVARTNSLVKEYATALKNAEIEFYEIKRGKSDNRSHKGVRVATMHRVKGLEFGFVFVAAANNNAIPLESAIDHTDAVSESESLTAEKCLLYVALTRAKERAYITGYGKQSSLLVG